jgi:hypothetical protein
MSDTVHTSEPNLLLSRAFLLLMRDLDLNLFYYFAHIESRYLLLILNCVQVDHILQP